MKRVFKLAAIAALSLSSYANVLMPEISRDGKTRNTSVMAVSQETRNFVVGDYTMQMLETDTTPSVDVDITMPNLAGGFSSDKFSAEVSYQNMNVEIDSAEGDLSRLDLLMGIRATNKLTLGFGITSNELTAAIDDTVLQFGGTTVVNDTTLGATLEHHMIEAGLAEGDYNVLTLAFGEQNQGVSWETGITYTTTGSGDYNGGSRLGVFAGGTKVVNDVELDANLDFVFGDYLDSDADDNDYTSITFGVDAEFLVGKMYYITPGVEYVMVDTPVDSSNSSLATLSGDFGYRANKLDATFGLSYTTGDLEEVDLDGFGINFNVGYVF